MHRDNRLAEFAEVAQPLEGLENANKDVPVPDIAGCPPRVSPAERLPSLAE
jgi:hypothetical protein